MNEPVTMELRVAVSAILWARIVRRRVARQQEKLCEIQDLLVAE